MSADTGRSRSLVPLFAGVTFLAGGAVFLARTARDALFLARFDRSALAYMVFTSALVSAGPLLLYTLYGARLPRARLVLGSHALAAATFAVFTFVGEGARWPLAVLYNVVELFAVLSTLQVMTLAGDAFSTREARRVFPVLAACGVFGAIGLGLLASGALKLRIVTTADLLRVVVVLLGVQVLLLGGIFRRLGSRAWGAPTSRPQKLRQLFANRHVRLIGALGVGTAFLVSVVDFQFKALSQSHFTTAQGLQVDAMSAFYGVFFGATYLAAALLQLLATGRVLERFGVMNSLSVFPAFVVVGSVWLAAGAAPLFVMGVALKGSEGFLRYGLHSSTTELLYLPLPLHLRARAKSLVDGVLQAGATGLCGLLLVVLVGPLGLSPPALGLVSVVVGLVYLGLVFASRRGYLRQLLAGLRRSGLVVRSRTPDEEARALNALRAGLGSADVADVRTVLGLVEPGQVRALDSVLRSLLRHADAEVRAGAARWLRTCDDPALARSLLALENDPAEAARVEAIRAVGVLPTSEFEGRLADLLEHGSPRLRAAATGVVLRRKAPRLEERAERVLAGLLASASEDERSAAAEVLGYLGDPERHAALVTLLKDRSPAVQRSALLAAGHAPDARVMPFVVHLLRETRMRGAAAASLVRSGVVAVPALHKALVDERESLEVRRAIPRILARIAAEETLAPLVEALGARDVRLRRDAARSAAQVCAFLSVRVPPGLVRTHLRSEAERCVQNLALLADLEPVLVGGASDPLREVLEEYVRQGRDNLLCLLALIYPVAAVLSVRATLAASDPTLRANALEALDSLLLPEDRREYLPLFESVPAELLSNRNLPSGLRRQSAQAWLKELAVAEDSWLATAALHTVAELGGAMPLAEVRRLARHEVPTIREQAARVLACQLSPDELTEACAHLRADPNAQVRTYVRGVLDLAAELGPRPALGTVSTKGGEDPLTQLAAAARVVALFRFEGEALRCSRVLGAKGGDVAAKVSVALEEPSVFARAARSKLPVLDEAEEVTPLEQRFQQALEVGAPAARAVVPLLKEGELRGLLYLDSSEPMSNEQLTLALAAAERLD